MNKIALVLISLLCASLQAQSTSVSRIGDQEARAHLLHGVDPIYPMFAKVDHVHGDVILDVNVNADGNVTKMVFVSGPAMLAQWAGDAVRGWKFAPFQVNGKASAVVVELKLSFPTRKPRAETKVDAEVAESFSKKNGQCMDAVLNESWAKASARCEEALTIARGFPEESVRALEIEAAYDLYGRALVGVGQPGNALVQFVTAANMAKLYFLPGSYGYATPFYLCAATEDLMGNETAADSNYSIAENSYREIVTKAPWGKDEAAHHRLAEVLLRHASLADKTGKTSEAMAMRAEAAKVDQKAKLKDASVFPNLTLEDLF